MGHVCFGIKYLGSSMTWYQSHLGYSVSSVRSMIDIKIVFVSVSVSKKLCVCFVKRNFQNRFGFKIVFVSVSVSKYEAGRPPQTGTVLAQSQEAILNKFYTKFH